MTRYAKILLFVNLALSLTFVAWTIGLYTQRLPWTTTGAGDEKVVGRIDELTARVKTLVDARDRAEERWFAATTEVIRLHKDLKTQQNFYADQWKLVESGVNLKGEPKKPAVQQLQFENGLLVTKLEGRPAFQIDGKDALSFAGYRANIEQQLEEIRNTKLKINKVVADTTVITNQINGLKQADQAITAQEKGLRGQILDAQTLTNSTILEQEFLQTPLTNVKVDLDSLRRRQLALQARLNELTASVRR